MQLINLKRLKKIFLLCLLFLASANIAFASDTVINTSALSTKSGPIHIQADHFSFERKSNKVTFSGHVVITQAPATTIHADTLYLYTDANRKLQKAQFYGDPTQYHADATSTQAATNASAHEMIFDNAKQMITLNGKAFVQQGENIFSGPVINYDLQKKMITSHASAQERVNVEIKMDNQQTSAMWKQ